MATHAAVTVMHQAALLKAVAVVLKIQPDVELDHTCLLHMRSCLLAAACVPAASVTAAIMPGLGFSTSSYATPYT